MINFDYAQAVQVAQDFKKLLNEVQQTLAICDAEIVEADKAFGDIRHFCEFKYPSDAKDQRKVCRLLNQYSQQRRQAKDIQDILQPLAEWLEKNSATKSNLIYALNGMDRAFKRTEGERLYAPRVVDDLFTKGG